MKMNELKKYQCDIFGLLLLVTGFVHHDNIIAASVLATGAFLCWGIQEVLDQMRSKEKEDV